MSNCTGTAEFATDFNLVEAIEKETSGVAVEEFAGFPPLKVLGKCSPAPFRSKFQRVCTEIREHADDSV
jgi:hypothetical protein